MERNWGRKATGRPACRTFTPRACKKMSLRIPFDRCAWPLLAGSAGLLALAVIGFWRMFAVGVGSLLALLALFFRDPERRITLIRGAVVSPADGQVTGVSAQAGTEAGPFDGPRITIVLSVWNVHVNRVPQDGVVESMAYSPGGHALAWSHSAAENESNWIHVRSNQHRIVVRQVASKLARRVVCRLNVGDQVQRGQRLGIIKFGSRTDLYLPKGSSLLVRAGDKVRGGSSIVAMLRESGSGCQQ